MVFPAIASIFLLLLYFLLQAGITSLILIAVNLVYVLATTSASGTVIFLPIATACAPASIGRRLVRVPCLSDGGDGSNLVPLTEVIAFLLGLLVASVSRHRNRTAALTKGPKEAIAPSLLACARRCCCSLLATRCCCSLFVAAAAARCCCSLPPLTVSGSIHSTDVVFQPPLGLDVAAAGCALHVRLHPLRQGAPPTLATRRISLPRPHVLLRHLHGATRLAATPLRCSHLSSPSLQFLTFRSWNPSYPSPTPPPTLTPPLPLPQVFISPMIFHKSIMVAVATAGQSTASVSTGGVCERTEGDTFPMLFLVPRMHAILTPFDGVYIPPLPPPPPYSDPSLDSLPWYLPTRGGLLWRIS